MKKIDQFLGKFKSVLELTEFNKNTIVSVIERAAGEKVGRENIKIINKTIYLRNSPYLKRKAFLNKNKILGELKNSLLNLVIEDIR